MKAYIVLNPLGVFAVSEKSEILDRIPFSEDTKKIVDNLLNDNITKEEEEIIGKLKKKGYGKFVASKKNEKYEFEKNNLGEEFLRKNFRNVAKDLGYSDEKLNSLLTRIGIELTKRKTKELVKKDRIVIQGIDAIDEIDKSINIFVARLREWYGLHFPEMGRKVEKHEKFVRIVSEFGLRDKVEDGELRTLAKESMGIDLSEEDEKILKDYASRIRDLYKLREKMEKYIDKVMKEIAPNFSGLAGSLLAARLIALAGSMDKLAKKPSSTVQLLGSEKALFRYLRGHGRSPKHGILYTHALIQKAPPKERGRIARILASKLSIAIKIDYYGKEDRSEEMKKDLERRIKKVVEK